MKNLIILLLSIIALPLCSQVSILFNDTSICSTSGSIDLSSKANPNGGNWVGPGVSNNTFNPSLLGGSSFKLKYELSGDTDSVNVTVYQSEYTKIEVDTQKCGSFELKSTITSGNYAYLWSNGSSNSTIHHDVSFGQIDTSIFWLKITDGNGCSDIDSVEIIFDKSFEGRKMDFKMIIGNDTLIKKNPSHYKKYCKDDLLELKYHGNLNYRKTWNDAEELLYTNHNGPDSTSYLINTGTVLELKVIDQFNCSDSIRVDIQVNELTDLKLSGITEKCLGDTTELSVDTNLDSVYWHFDASNLYSFKATKSGNYRVTGIDTNGCKLKDSLVVTFKKTDSSSVLQACAFSDTILTTVNGKNYIWNNGATAPSISVHSGKYERKYWVNIDSSSTCIKSDTIYVKPVPCDSAFKFSGFVYIDKNKNGKRDSLEKGLSGLKVILTNPYQVAFTDKNGFYDFLVFKSLNAKIICETPSHIKLGMNQVDTLQATNFGLVPGESKNNDFGFNYNQNSDLRTTLHSSILRPGFDGNAFLYFENLGASTIYNLESKFQFDTLLNVDQNVSGALISVISKDTFKIEVDSIAPMQKIKLVFDIQVPAGENYIGREVCFYSELDFYNDPNLVNNKFKYCRRISGSYDPNHKEASVGDGQIDSSLKELNYTIQFQNTGTDTAFFITVVDTLNPNFYDVFSLKMLNSSHNYKLDIDSSGIATWRFDNILLVDSITNEPLSHGNVTFNIRLKEGLTYNDTIRNEAHIYFDFNSPIKTNNSRNYFKSITTSIHEHKLLRQLSLFPNPTKDFLYFQIEELIDGRPQSYQIYDYDSKLVLSGKLNKGLVKVDIRTLAKGAYLIKVDGYNATSFIVK